MLKKASRGDEGKPEMKKLTNKSYFREASSGEMRKTEREGMTLFMELMGMGSEGSAEE